jgi:hypothetical protein
MKTPQAHIANELIMYGLRNADAIALDLIRGLEDLGYVMVPVEPTEEMRRAGDRHADEPMSWIYRAMLAARPGAR